jgi:hypothetical protein
VKKITQTVTKPISVKINIQLLPWNKAAQKFGPLV